jgi:hypothetical protein
MKTTPDHAQEDCISWVKYSALSIFRIAVYCSFSFRHLRHSLCKARPVGWITKDQNLAMIRADSVLPG